MAQPVPAYPYPAPAPYPYQQPAPYVAYHFPPQPGWGLPPPAPAGGQHQQRRSRGGRGRKRKKQLLAEQAQHEQQVEEEGYGNVSLASLQREHKRKVARRQAPSPWHPVPSPMPINAPPAPKDTYEQRLAALVPESPGALLATPQHRAKQGAPVYGGDLDADAARLGLATGVDFLSSGYGLALAGDEDDDGFSLGSSLNASGSDTGSDAEGGGAAEVRAAGEGAPPGEPVDDMQRRLTQLEDENLDLREERQNLRERQAVMERQLAALRRRLADLGEDPDAVLAADGGIGRQGSDLGAVVAAAQQDGGLAG